MKLEYTEVSLDKPPLFPVAGQIWYDERNKVLSVWDNYDRRWVILANADHNHDLLYYSKGARGIDLKDWGYLRIGKTRYEDPDPGVWLGAISGLYFFDIGDANSFLRWDGNDLIVTGAKIVTASGGARVELLPDLNTGIIAYDADGNAVFQIDVDGANQGDVVIGNYTGGQGAYWDNESQTFTVRGALAVNSLDVGESGFVRGGATDYDTGDGFWLGYDREDPSSTHKVRIGTVTDYLRWTGDTLETTGLSIASSFIGTKIQLLPDANTGIKILNDDDIEVFKVLVGGDHSGDVIIGKYDSGAGAKWDDSAGLLTVLGNFAANSIDVGEAGFVRGGASDYVTGSGFWFGYDGVHKARIGSLSKYVRWNGTNLEVTGATIKSSEATARVEILQDEDIGLVAYNNAGIEVFKIITGSDVTSGDIYFGNYAGGQGAMWDNDPGQFLIRGSIVANSVDVSTTGFLKGGAENYTTGAGFWLGYDTGNAVLNTHKVRIGDPAGSMLTWNGELLSVIGDIQATSGYIGDLTVSGLLQVGVVTPHIHIDGSIDNPVIETSDYASGTQGWRLASDGFAEFGNVSIRGALKATVFEKSAITAFAGSQIITKSASTLASAVTLSATTFTILVKQQGGDPPFASGDWVSLRTVIPAPFQVLETFGIVTGAGTEYGENCQYTITYKSGTSSGTIPAGETVIDYGVAGTGGKIQLTAEATYHPYIEIATFTEVANAPYWTERARLGNLRGIYGFADVDDYGLWTDNGYFIGSVKATSGYIGGTEDGWKIETGKLTSTNIGLATLAGNATYAMWAGGTPGTTAPFTVTHTGVLRAIGANIKSHATGAGVSILPVPQVSIAATNSIGEYVFAVFADSYLSYFDSADVLIGRYTSGKYVLWDDSAARLKIYGEIYSTYGTIGGWVLGANTLKDDWGVVSLDSTYSRISVGGTDIGTSGVQMQYDVWHSLSKFYAGDGADNYLRFDGVNVSFKSPFTELSAAGVLTATGANIKSHATGAGVQILPDPRVAIAATDTGGNYVFAVFASSILTFHAGDVIIGKYNDGKYVLWDEVAGKLIIHGEVTATTGAIGGFNIGSTTLADAASHIVLDSANYKVSVGGTTFGSAGVQLQYAGGYGKFYAGDGPDNYLQFDGTKVLIKSTNLILDSSGNLTVTGVVNAGTGYLGGSSSAIEIDNLGLIIGLTGRIYGGKSTYASDTSGYWIGYDATVPAGYKLHIGGVSNYLKWTGSRLILKGENIELNDSGNLTVTGTVNARAGSFGTGSSVVSIDDYGLIIGSSSGRIYGGKTTYASTTAGFWLGYDSAYKFHIGDATHFLNFTGTALEVTGAKIMSESSGSRVEFFQSTTVGMVAYDADSAEVFKIITDGADAGDVIIGNSLVGTNYAKWDKDAGTFTVKGDVYAKSVTVSGDANGYVRGGATDYTTGVGFWLGYDSAAPAGYKVRVGDPDGNKLTWDGTDLSVTGAINATSGTISGLLNVGTGTPHIHIDGALGNIGTSDYASDTKGWQITASGDAEFNNASIRGSLRTTVFQYGQILATSGSIWVTPAAGKAYEQFTTLDTPFYIYIEDPEGVTHAFSGGFWAVNDIIRVKQSFVSSYIIADFWGKITAVYDPDPLGSLPYWRLTVTKQSPAAGTNYTFTKGAAVVNFKTVTDSWGAIRLCADDPATTPYIGIMQTTATPWTGFTERARLGNLKGLDGHPANDWGLWTDNGYFTGTIVANLGRIGGAAGWEISTGKITGTTTGLATSGTYAFWAGSATDSAAPFSVTHTGIIKAESGTIGGWTLGSSTFYSSNMVLDATNKKLYIGGSTFGSAGIQLALVSGTGNLYVGNGANEYFKYESAAISFKSAKSTLAPGGKFTCTDIEATGYIHGTTGYFGTADTAVKIDGEGLTIGSTGFIKANKTGYTDTANNGLWMGRYGSYYAINIGNATDYVKFSGTKLSWAGTNTSLTEDGHFSATSATISGKITLGTDSSGLDNLADGSTYKKTTASEKSGAGYAYTGLDSDGDVKRPVVSSNISGSGPTTGSSIYIDSTQIAMYLSGTKKVEIKTDGTWRMAQNCASAVGDTNKGIEWNGSALNVRGTINADDITVGKLSGRTVEAISSGTGIVLDGVNNKLDLYVGSSVYVSLDDSIISDPVFGDFSGLKLSHKQGLIYKEYTSESSIIFPAFISKANREFDAGYYRVQVSENDIQFVYKSAELPTSESRTAIYSLDNIQLRPQGFKVGAGKVVIGNPSSTYSTNLTVGFPDIGSESVSANFVISAGDQTVGGVKTFGSPPQVNSLSLFRNIERPAAVSTYAQIYRIEGIDDDSSTVLLLHGEGTDGSSTILDAETAGGGTTRSGRTAKSVTNSGAEIDTAKYKTGTASILFTASQGDYLTVPDGADWYFSTGDFTIEAWIWPATLPSSGDARTIVYQESDDNNCQWFYLFNNTGTYEFRYLVKSSSSDIIFYQGKTPVTINANTAWYHVALVRKGNCFRAYVNGQQCTDGSNPLDLYDSDAVPDFTGALYVGLANRTAGAYGFDGWIDSLRITKGLARYQSRFQEPLNHLTYLDKDGNESRAFTYSLSEETFHTLPIHFGVRTLNIGGPPTNTRYPLYVKLNPTDYVGIQKFEGETNDVIKIKGGGTMTAVNIITNLPFGVYDEIAGNWAASTFGAVTANGVIKATGGYQSADGSTGYTGTIDVTAIGSIVVKNGLIISAS